MRGLPAAALVLLIAGCAGPRRSADPVARDQEIIRDILWHYHGQARFEEIRVTCLNGEVTLSGRVPSEADRAEAVGIARRRDVKALHNKLEVRPR
jgi:osmotically-inducible protein OsmY